MKLKILLIVAIALAMVSPLSASVLFTFTGTNGLSGSFILDESLLVIDTSHGTFTTGSLVSPNPVMSGIYGAYSFMGTASLSTLHQLVPLTDFLDDWFIFSTFTAVHGPDGPMPTGLHILLEGPNLANPSSIEPRYIPPPGVSDFSSFEYTMPFSDGSFHYGNMSTLTFSEVSEPSTLSLGLCGLLAVLLVRPVSCMRVGRGV